MFNLTLKSGPVSAIDDITEDITEDFTSTGETDETFTPQNRAKYLFTLMDGDQDDKADYNDFKRVVLADAEIIRGFLVYDGVI